MSLQALFMLRRGCVPGLKGKGLTSLGNERGAVNPQGKMGRKAISKNKTTTKTQDTKPVSDLFAQESTVVLPLPKGQTSTDE